MLMSSFGTTYVLNKHECLCQYDPYAIPCDIMHPANLVKQHKILIELSYEEAGTNLALIMSLTSMTLTNDLEKLVNLWHYHYQCMSHISEQSIQDFLSWP